MGPSETLPGHQGLRTGSQKKRLPPSQGGFLVFSGKGSPESEKEKHTPDSAPVGEKSAHEAKRANKKKQ